MTPTRSAMGDRPKDVTDLIGDNGNWQRCIFVATVVIAIPLATHNLVMTFYAPNVDFWCARSAPNANLSLEETAIDTKCFRYQVHNTNYTRTAFLIRQKRSIERHVVPCKSWEYDESYYGSTLRSKFDLVCDKEWFVSLSKSIFIAGYLVSVLVFGYLADRFGRKPVIAICNCIAVVSSILCAFSTTFTMFSVCRFFIAFGIAGSFTTNFVLLMEVVGSEYRTIYGISVNFGWCFGYVTLPAVVYLLRDWFWVQLLITTPLLCLVFTWRILPESPRWLLAKGKLEKARRTISSAMKANGNQIDDLDYRLQEIMAKTSKEEQSTNSGGNVFSLLITPGVRHKTVIILLNWFVIAFVYYGLSYNTNELAGDPFVNFVTSGLVEIPANALSLFLIRSLGRRNPLAATLVTGGIACLLMYPLPQDPWWLCTAVSMVGKFSITCSFGIVYVFTAEIFPTVLRNQGMGMASVCGRFGNIIAPFVRELGFATHPMVPQLFFGVLAVTSGVLVLLLPETNNAIVPDTLEEAALPPRTKLSPNKKDAMALTEVGIKNPNSDIDLHCT